MCWVRVPNHAIAHEVRARLDSDSAAVALTGSGRGKRRGWVFIVAAFAVGVAVGLLW